MLVIDRQGSFIGLVMACFNGDVAILSSVGQRSCWDLSQGLLSNRNRAILTIEPLGLFLIAHFLHLAFHSCEDRSLRFCLDRQPFVASQALLKVLAILEVGVQSGEEASASFSKE